MASRRIALFQTDFRLGGIQRSLLTLLKDKAFSSCVIDLYLFERGNLFQNTDLPDNVSIHYLKKMPAVFKVIPFGLARLLASPFYPQLKPKYDLSIDFNGYSPECAYYALKAISKKRVIWVHNDYSERMKFDWKFRIAFRAFKEKYSQFDCVVAVSEGVANSIIGLTDVDPNKLLIIPNLINESEINQLSAERIELIPPVDKVNVICVGRLDLTKNVIETVKIAIKLICEGVNINLFFLGSGPLQESISSLVVKSNLTDRIVFLGNKANPYPYMKCMDALLLNSRFEGQGIVLREAQCLGLQLIFPKRLEKYNNGLNGVESVEDALRSVHKMKSIRPKQDNVLDCYNASIRNTLESLFDEKTI